MKKYQYIVAIACVLVGAVGFASMYAIDQSQKKLDNQKQYINYTQNSETETENKNELVQNQDSQNASENEQDENLEPNVDGEQVAENEPDASNNPANGQDATVGTVNKEILHFQPEKGLIWPVQGPVVLDYSMNATIYHPTLQQYQYNPAMVIAGEVNSKVYFVAKGKITNIETNEVTGCTVTQDLGDGYTAIYGQLKELNFEVGDMVESGQVVGYISEPTKYFAVEGPNVYFQLLKDGVPMDPEEILNE